MTCNIENLTRYRSMELARDSQNSGYSFAQTQDQTSIVYQIKRMASSAKDAYMRLKSYGTDKLDNFGLVNANFEALKKWAWVSKLFTYLNSNYRVAASEDYREFKDCNAATMGWFSQRAYMEAA
jgi:hypothetical protein